jgi:hypothetical protein
VRWLAVTLALYHRILRRAAELTVRNWPVLGSLFVYALVMSAALALAPALGLIGGFLLSFVWAACVGSFLYLVEMIVRTARVTLDDFRRSAGAYLWDVVGVTFVLWIAFRLLAPVLATVPQGPMLLLGLNIVVLVFFNAVPELMYLGRCSSLELLGESYVFIGENWIEWFPVTFALGALVLALAVLPVAPVLQWPKLAAVALLVYYTMVVRGLLFLELHGSTRRSRAFRHRMGG